MDDRELIPDISHEDEELYFYLWDTQMDFMQGLESLLFPCMEYNTNWNKVLPCREYLIQMTFTMKSKGIEDIMNHFYASRKKIFLDVLKEHYADILFEIKMTGEYHHEKPVKIRKELS